MKILVENKKTYYDYQVLEKFGGGLVLSGQEVKSIKIGKASLRGAFVIFKAGEPFLINANIPAYQPKNAPKDYDPASARKLLLKKKEIDYLMGKSRQKGLTIVPLKMYTIKDRIKIEIGVARGKREIDKREKIKKRDIEREIKRSLKKNHFKT